MGIDTAAETFIAQWRDTGGSELANTQSFINGLCALIGVPSPNGSRSDDTHNNYVFERRVFQDNGDGTQSFGRIDAYKRGCFILEAKQGSDADRAAAARGEDDFDLFGQTASARMKRGTARRGTPGWAKAMVQAKGQAERYAKALPADHGWPPFLLVADIGYCIEVYADFTGTGKAYAQFPDRARYRIMLDDLRHEDVRHRLASIWTDPKSLDPAAHAARVTREVADLLATVSKRLEARGHAADSVSAFLMRVLFTMFAEDTKVLLPENSFKGLLRGQLDHPEHLHQQLSSLWAAMDRGEFAPALGVPVKRFNGYLFKETAAIPLDADELKVLIQAADKNWTEVEPAIFGTLLERALNAKDRAKLGAHYTPRAYVERLIGPTIMEPLRADWNGVRTAAAELVGTGEAQTARALVEAFHAKLAGTKVLDPACGTGNFLYVAMARMKELEGEVLDLLIELGDQSPYLADLSSHTITPENFLGIEVNPRAAAIAQLVLWIGYLQWHFRVNGADKAPPEPILRDVRTIECRDALIDWDERVLERDERGEPLSRWDGETTKVHPVTGMKVPDEAARVEVYRYIRPRAAKWPKADFIVGNPPFIGKGKRAADYLGRPYLNALKSVSKVKLSADYVMHWWDRAANLVRTKQARRFGFITSATITQQFNTKVVRLHAEAKKSPASIVFAVPDHPWVDEKGSAAIRIAMTVGIAGRENGQLLHVTDESGAPDQITFTASSGKISATLTTTNDVKSAKPLKGNDGLCSPGIKTFGAGFIIDGALARRWQTELTPEELIVLKPYFGGKDVTDRWRGKYVIDVDHLDEIELRSQHPAFYNHIYNHVKPERDQNNEESRKLQWWKFGRRNTELRNALNDCDRFIVTTETAKHRLFVMLEPPQFPEGGLVVVASSDAFLLGILSSKIHFKWMQRAKGALETRPRYNKQRCFDPFPFPADVPEPLKDRIRAEAEALDALRKRVLADHADLTLTKLYNVLEAMRAGTALSDAERDIHDRGLVTLIRQHHDAIDAAVAEAYGWPADLSDEDILTRLVALNKERASEEARGLIRWLRPDYQAPSYAAPVADRFDLGEAPAVAPDNVIAWPASLPDQVSAVQAVLAAAPAPLRDADVARAFRGKRAATVRPVLDALTGIGMARRLQDGRYAA